MQNPVFATLSAKGQLVVPKNIREALGMEAGTRVALFLEGNRIILQPSNRRLAEELCGITAGGVSMTDELLAERRAEERRRDEVLGM